MNEIVESNYPRLESLEQAKPSLLDYIYRGLNSATVGMFFLVPLFFLLNYLRSDNRGPTPTDADIYLRTNGSKWFEDGSIVVAVIFGATLLFLIAYSIFFSKFKMSRDRAFVLPLFQTLIIAVFSAIAVGLRGY